MINGMFTVQLHMHTAETSGCGVDGGADMARACKAAGYDLIVITDHFFNANIGCPRDLPWKDKVEYMFRGYRAAKEVGDKIGLTVLKGWETFTKGPEYLTYGLEEDFLLAHPDIADLPKDEYLRVVREAGGFCVHAHPFRKAPYIPEFTPDPYTVEAFEVFNAGNKDPLWNQMAHEMAEKHHLLEIAGSDAHSCDRVTGGAMCFPMEFHDSKGLIAALRSGKGMIVEKLR